ncbi:MAG: hypothetical protein ABSF98_01075 [Bryobacteraceae bacterium]|jgi:hypothetical protein
MKTGPARHEIPVLLFAAVVFFGCMPSPPVLLDDVEAVQAQIARNMRKPGQLVADDRYYTWSSVFSYAKRDALLLNGRVNNLEYGSHAPGAPDVFIDDAAFARLWSGGERAYLLADDSAVPRFRSLAGPPSLLVVKHSGGETLFTNHAYWN